MREKIGNALKDMPEHPEIRELLTGTNINFFHCGKIVEILKETEKDSKNFLGQYGSQRMTDWKEILGLYEKENIYIAEASQLLIQSVVYELPGFKKQITKVTCCKYTILHTWLTINRQCIFQILITVLVFILDRTNTRGL